VISPEQIMKPDGEFERLLKNQLFMARVVSVVIDEAHCLTEWGEFRPEYRELGRLRYILPPSTPLLIASATFTKHALGDVTRLLHMHHDKTITVHCSSDRPNIEIGIRKIKYAMSSFADLAFLIPDGIKVGDPPPPKFLVFFDDIPNSIAAVHMMRRRLPRELQDKIKWFNSDMSAEYKDETLDDFVKGLTWGLFTTTSFGMVRTIEILVLGLLFTVYGRAWMFRMSSGCSNGG
jgi:superfamily II DNA helicase RecQ